MKRLDKHKQKNYGPVKLEASDLKELLEILNAADGVQLVADDVEFESVDELFRELNGKHPQEVKLKSFKPYINVDLQRMWARLHVIQSDVLSLGIFAQIDAVLTRCERRPRFLFRFGWVLAIFWAIQVLAFAPQLRPYGTITSWLSALVFVWFLWVLFVNMRRFSLVSTDLTENRRSFWKRNSDSVVVALISALGGAILGAGATKAIDNLWPKSSADGVPIHQEVKKP